MLEKDYINNQTSEVCCLNDVENTTTRSSRIHRFRPSRGVDIFELTWCLLVPASCDGFPFFAAPDFRYERQNDFRLPHAY